MTKAKFIIIAISLFLMNCGNNNPIDESTTDHKNFSLLVAEYDKNSETGNYTYLVSYNLRNGKLLSIDTLISASTDEIHYGFGGKENQILDNRYVITALGNIIDLESKKLLKKETDPYVYRKGDILVFDTDKSVIKEGYSEYDLTTGETKFIVDSFFTPNRQFHSPDDKYKLIIDAFSKSIKLFERENKIRTIVENAGSGTPMSVYSSQRPSIPVIWTDSINFIYAKFQHVLYDYDSYLVQIRSVNIISDEDQIITEIDSIPPSMSNARFYNDFDNNIIFSCSKGDYLIDIGYSNVNRYDYKIINNDFSIGLIYDSLGIKVKHKETEIGELWCKGYTAKATEGHIALEYANVGDNLGYPKGVKIWSEITNEWITIEIPWICSMVGWYEK